MTRKHEAGAVYDFLECRQFRELFDQRFSEFPLQEGLESNETQLAARTKIQN